MSIKNIRDILYMCEKNIKLYDLMTTKDLNKFCKDNNIDIDWATKVIRDTHLKDKNGYWKSATWKRDRFNS